MKILLCSLLLITAASCYADIQDPPANDYGPTRKLARALANLCPVSSATEIPSSAVLIAPASVRNIFPPPSKWRTHASAASTHTAALKCR